MKRIVKQVAGIDVAQDELVVCLGRMTDDWKPELFASKNFVNNLKGFQTLMKWVDQLTDPLIGTRYVMEATGVYHEKLAYYLAEQEQVLSIILPNKISNFIRTLSIKTITDKTASEGITMFGLEKQLDDWKRPDPLFKRVRQLTRERDQLIQERTMVSNQLHAEKAEAEPGADSIRRMNIRKALLTKQIAEVFKQIQSLIKTDAAVKKSVHLICSITGIGLLTAATVLAETNGFDLIRSKGQLASYAGLDVKEKQSGTSVKGKPRISKKGNKYLRKAMHMPALSCISHDERFKGIFARLVARHGIKMKAVVAVQRRLLEMMYVIYKTQTPYDREYLQKNEAELLLKN